MLKPGSLVGNRLPKGGFGTGAGGALRLKVERALPTLAVHVYIVPILSPQVNTLYRLSATWVPRKGYASFKRASVVLEAWNSH